MSGVMQDRVVQTPVGDVIGMTQRLTDTWIGLSQSIVDGDDDECLKRFIGLA